MFMAIATYLSPVEAHVSRGLLESEGIPAHLESEHHVWASWPMSHALGGVRVLVPAEFATLAVEILARRERGEFEAALEEQGLSPAYQCAKCGSTELRQSRSWTAIFTGLVISFFLGAIFPIPKDRSCKACGATADAEQ